jgi:hypothetical protein
MPPETVTECLVGNGLVIERTEKECGGTPWWWIMDERRVSKANSQTYHHRDILKANGCRWSNKRRAWYRIGIVLPDEIAALVGVQDKTPVPTEEERVQRALRHFAESFQVDLARLLSTPSLPAIATVRLDDPWA